MESLKLVTLSREEFFNELWDYTAQELRIRYALTPYGLQQLCQKYHCPVPPMGYWMKAVHHNEVGRRKPPKLTDPNLQTVHLLLLEADPARCKLSRVPIRVAEQLDTPHELIRSLRRSRTPDSASPVANLVVNSQSQNRALRILDAMIKAFEAAGGQFFGNHTTKLWGRDPDGVCISLESLNPEANSAATAPGRLVLEITTNRQVAVPSRWADTERQSVEKSLRPVINSIFESAARLRWRRLENECVARQQEKCAAVQKGKTETEIDVVKEQEFERALVRESKQFLKSTLIRRYIREIRRRATANAASDYPDGQWLQRAQRYADRIDPLAKRFVSATKANPPPNFAIDDLDITGRLRMRLAELSVKDLRALSEMNQRELCPIGCDELWSEATRVLRTYGYEVAAGTTRYRFQH
jgi:hypothetical protein